MTNLQGKHLDPRPIDVIKSEMDRKREAEEAGAMMIALARIRDRERNACRAMGFLAQQLRAGCVDTTPTNLGTRTADTSGIESILDLMSEALQMGEQADYRELDRLERLLGDRIGAPVPREPSDGDQ
jgi:hypothetical protein